MSFVSRSIAGGLVAAAIFAVAPAQATQIPNGKVSAVLEDTPLVDLTGNPNTYSVDFGTTFEITAIGGFSGAAHKLGTMDGLITFSDSVGTKLDQNLADFFVFSDGAGGTFNFSVTSVTTKSLALASGSNAISLYILGNTVDTHKGYAATATSLTLTFGNTGGSDYSASMTLAVPPDQPPPSNVTAVPEPATWALSLIGFGAMGAALRRRPRVRQVTFA